MARAEPILIAGAGIAGLAAALGLARRGFGVTLLERQSVLAEAGAGIQIGPNGVKALAALGLREAVEAVAFRPAGLAIRQGATGALMTTLPWGEVAEKRYGAPFLTLLRTELQAGLLPAVRAQPGIELVTGFEVAGVVQVGDTVSARSSDGRMANGAALVGADGLWSGVRGQITPDPGGSGKPLPTGYAAYRAVVARENLQAPFDKPEVGIWLGRAAHVVHYPVCGGDQLNLVVVIQDGAPTEDWDGQGRLGDIAPHLSKWSANLQNLLARAAGWRRWTLCDLPPLARWSEGRVGLIGDAAHPVLPFLAQGAVMALEDAVVLAALAGRAGRLEPEAFAAFERIRRPRLEKLAAASRRNGRTYHMAGPAALVRDAVLRATPPQLLQAQWDWLYRFNPDADLNT